MPSSMPLPAAMHLPGDISKKESSSERRYLIYFLPGNPGVVAFYQRFLNQLSEALRNSKAAEYDVEIFGTSLAGFECDAPNPSYRAQNPPVDIDGQIEFVEKKLSRYLQSKAGDGGEPTRVVLVGHSLGAYLAMEMLQRRRDSLRAKETLKYHYRLVSAIGLFPGLVHLAQGTMPAKLAWLDSVPWGAPLLSTLVRLVCLLIPAFILQRIIATATGYPAEDADIASRWLRSKWGLHESLHLAKEEMKRIADDTWDEEVWGSPHPTILSEPRPKLFFLFGEHDDWIPSGPRDELIAARGRPAGTEGSANEWRATMEIERTGIRHDFAVKHSRPVAVKVAGWIEQIVESDAKAA
ncbi:hypothetical protein M409DRAFT_48815 [Zasmidium cellare ATCC 36951]|uniref:AB hydrolase-1 domain-containing protein n=1 Tax=Zasmidium cellare ATCC 36951 TaxID=1080233 RepID=A0A6A6D3B8_ZASCE|nr:uncharacterized protein M409DRAFT_48815 [Zasmidium cellare ATCC 36951]KAF2173904.1 hypothetical protein M409DRAFT_48815 [Zasmidium cellare ATCC 36951]